MLAGPLAKVAGSLIDNLFETEEERANARAKLMKLEQDGQFREIEIHMSAILAEAKSADPWTSRARPAFLYVVYIYILAAIPMGILFAVSPEVAANVTKGVGSWLNAIPESIITLFGAGYLGYSGLRTFDKAKLLKAKDGG
tara:strand:+ start:69 stop:491 length:423 start_codon:yes stop_codon:yes gene_type:complete